MIWGDDQYENFKEDIIPPFCLMAYEAFEIKPWEDRRGPTSGMNRKTRPLPGAPRSRKFLTNGLLESGFDLSYAYKPLHHHLGHAFLNTLLYLDYDRQGLRIRRAFPGELLRAARHLQRGGVVGWGSLPTEDELDPPSPAPWRCFDLGAATAGAEGLTLEGGADCLLQLVARLSHPRITCCTPTSRQIAPSTRPCALVTIRSGATHRCRRSRKRPARDAQLDVPGGAMAELGRKPSETELVQTYIFNSSKCFAYFKP